MFIATRITFLVAGFGTRKLWRAHNCFPVVVVPTDEERSLRDVTELVRGAKQHIEAVRKVRLLRIECE